MNQVTTPNKRFLGSLVILRGIAAMAVVFCHFGNAIFASGGALGIYKVFGDYGERGVDVFFVVSGFVIPYSLYRGRYFIRHFGTFIKKRLLRLQIPFIASLLMTVVILFATSFVKGDPANYGLLDFIRHFFYVGAPGINPVYWSLRVEAQYYVYIGLLMPLLLKYPKAVALLSLPLSILMPLVPGIHILLWKYLAFFHLGIVGFMLFENLGDKRINYGVLLALAAWLGFESIPGFIAAVGALLFILYYDGTVPKVLDFLGKISYSLYLIHFPIGVKTINLIKRYIPDELNFLLFIGLTLLVVGLSAIFYRLFEKPAEQLSRKYRYYDKKPEVSTAT